MKNFFLILILLSQVVWSQKTELGKVTVEELKQKVHPIDSSASATILFKKGKTNFVLDLDGNWEIHTEVAVKIKIYKKEGFEFANQEVSLFTGGDIHERVSFSNAVTYNLVDGKIEKTKLKSDGEFTEAVNDSWKTKKIVMPSVREGSIIEFSYLFTSPYITNFNDWYFQAEIPVDFVQYDVSIPKYFKYNFVITGFEDIQIESGEKSNVYTKLNVPAVKEEEYVNNIKNYMSILKFELASIEYPNKPIKNIALDWEGVTKSIYERDQFGKELRAKNYFEEELNPIIANATERDEKIALILSFVQNKMTWNERNGYLCEKGVKKAFKERTGNAADINLMLVAMLRHAEIEANPILLSTRSNGISVFPNTSAYNYVIAGVEIEDHVILLDATSKFSGPDIIPLRALNWAGRIIRKNESSADINLNRNIISKEQVHAMLEVDGKGNISGNVRKQYFDYNAYTFREHYVKLSKESLVERIEKKHEGLTVSDYSISNEKELAKPVVENYKISLDDATEIIADRLLFSPLLLFQIGKNPFVEQVRKYPVDISYPFKDSYSVSVKIPEGYVVESAPKPVSMKLDNEWGQYTYNITHKNNIIQIVCNFSIHTPLIPAQDYTMLKSFFDEITKSQSEKIVLKKA